MKRKMLAIASSFLILLMVSACATTSSGRSSYDDEGTQSKQLKEPSLAVASMLRFEDIPVPSGFKILEGESFAFQNDVTRVALLKYMGARNLDNVVLFYKEQMLLYNWNPMNVIEYERRILNYERESESCIVTIESAGRKSIVTIAVSPKSKPMKVEVVREK